MKCTQQQKLESCVRVGYARCTEHGLRTWNIGTWCTPHDKQHAFSAQLVDQPERHHAHLNQANQMCNAHEFVAGRSVGCWMLNCINHKLKLAGCHF